MHDVLTRYFRSFSLKSIFWLASLFSTKDGFQRKIMKFSDFPIRVVFHPLDQENSLEYASPVSIQPAVRAYDKGMRDHFKCI